MHPSITFWSSSNLTCLKKRMKMRKIGRLKVLLHKVCCFITIIINYLDKVKHSTVNDPGPSRSNSNQYNTVILLRIRHYFAKINYLRKHWTYLQIFGFETFNLLYSNFITLFQFRPSATPCRLTHVHMCVDTWQQQRKWNGQVRALHDVVQ